MIVPGQTLGILGGGQLGRMIAIAAKQMGYRVAVLSSEVDSPATQVSDDATIGAYDDPDIAHKWAASVDAVTVEFENIQTPVLEAAAERTVVAPEPQLLHIAQHRGREKQALQRVGVPVAPFMIIDSAADLERALGQLQLPLVIKTAAWGYDGKGQRMVSTAEEARAAMQELDGQLVAEQRIDFAYEASTIVARSADGQTVIYPPIENLHRNHILDVSLCPTLRHASLADRCAEIGRAVAEGLQLHGILCIELFVMDDGDVLVNEIAPRPHNSGHLTIEAFSCNQFEMTVRAVCGLPLVQPVQRRPAAMANLLGDLWRDDVPGWHSALRQPETSLHLYGKHSPKPGRKMGHLTSLADSVELARQRVTEARAALGSNP